jgi:signal transduction histidine kinase
MSTRRRIGELLQKRRHEIIERWKTLVRNGGNRRPSEPALVDRIADFVDGMGRAIAVETEGHDDGLKGGAVAHAVHCLELGYQADELVREYMHLRGALYEELHDAWPDMPAEAWHPVDRVVDRAVNDVIHRLNGARDRRLRALERISKETISSPDMNALLEHLIEAFSQVAPEVDVAVIFLREGNALRKRAERGLDDAGRDFSLGIGEGFTGMIAARREPLFASDASSDPRVHGDLLSFNGVRALYGVPLVHEDELVGVAYVGSKRAYDLPKDDLHLVSGFAERAAALIAARMRADAMQETARLRDLFIGMLAHDLRSPLNAISGSAQMLLRNHAQESADRRVVLRILTSVGRMERLIADILDFARTRLGGGIPVEFSRVDLTELCQAAIGETEALRPGRVRFTNALDEAVDCDPQRMSQVLSNLLVNALEHAAEPGGTIDVRLFAAGEDAVMTVHNDGPPIPPELLPHLFEPFRRGDQRRVGLGLYITREIVVAHRGSIEVRSPERAGTTVTVRIPQRQEP